MIKRLIFVLALCAIVFTSFGVRPVAASASGLPVETHKASISGFTACIIRDIKILPQAKKLSPANYQKLEAGLNSLLNSKGVGFLRNNKYFDAILIGIQIGKFMGYDFIWGLGMVQDCWRYL